MTSEDKMKKIAILTLALFPATAIAASVSPVIIVPAIVDNSASLRRSDDFMKKQREVAAEREKEQAERDQRKADQKPPGASQ
jgi:hypothetical protein